MLVFPRFHSFIASSSRFGSLPCFLSLVTSRLFPAPYVYVFIFARSHTSLSSWYIKLEEEGPALNVYNSIGLIQYLTPLCAPNGGLKPGLCKTLPSSGRALGTASRGVHACVSTGEF